MSFQFPPIYDFPPFYTIQPNFTTREKQLQMWCNLALSYFRKKKITTLSVSESVGKLDLFTNKKIQRQLSEDKIRIVLDELVKRGNAQWRDKGKDSCSILWRKYDEWANLIYKWAFDNGLTNSVCTYYELLNGDMSNEDEFQGLDEDTLQKALEILVKQRKAQIFSGSNSDEMGVKFFHS
ncbi:ESCRT-II complex, vps25 subunit [Anaeromyces robustus]|uniref:Vacuolar protein-sorting-associated protein 25 n=1 Tax=Anaeromyces robustus TaxID=1754192 RepID=A0A1Y1X355_9FUNG|nr:ESCRT-II complex, vps25 subunit [Anaeromyces robustus]|eukprot:ORX79826.1 ESCRT-II complex, vps25 subunit [Anaeromyces robustus]